MYYWVNNILGKTACILFDNKRVNSETNEKKRGNLVFKCGMFNFNVRENQRFNTSFFISCRKNANYIENQCY